MEPIISVVIATFNRAVFLGEAIQSILHQTLTDFEIIVIDDGSVDETAALVKGFSDSRIRYVYQTNQGRSAARNKGMDLAKGEYVSFLDDDDCYLERKLEKQVAFLTRHPEMDLVASGYQTIDQAGHMLSEVRPWVDLPEISFASCLWACPIIPSTVLIRRESVGRLGIKFDSTLEPIEDKDFFLQFLLAGGKANWEPEVLSAYRLHGNNSQVDAVRYHASRIRMLDQLFHRTDLPYPVASKRRELYFQSHLLGSSHAFETGQVPEGQEALVKAVEFANPGNEKTYREIALHFAGYADRPTISDPEEYLNFVFNNLPPSLQSLGKFKRYAFSALHMKVVFQKTRGSRFTFICKWLKGVWYSPAWLLNKGVWSLLLKRMVAL